MSNDKTIPNNQLARADLAAWQQAMDVNWYRDDPYFQALLYYHIPTMSVSVDEQLALFADNLLSIEPLVIENALPQNLPRLKRQDAYGNTANEVIHHPNYDIVGDVIYGSDMLAYAAEPGRLKDALALFYLSCHLGEAGHNCPVACTVGVLRVLDRVKDVPQKEYYRQKLIEPTYTNSFTGAQFLTEIQGGSDVGKNCVRAEKQADNTWKIYGEKWFCSNANADLILMTARVDEDKRGTKGLGLFLVPAQLPTGQDNHYRIRRLKEKMGTVSMASGEFEFEGAIAYPMGPVSQGFNLMMEQVLHTSRIYNSACVLGMAHRAYDIAAKYAKHRQAFGHAIIEYPLIQQHLAKIRVENLLLLCATFAMADLQDQADESDEPISEEDAQWLRLLANGNKYLSALWSAEHIHHCIDILAGNGLMEDFSILPRLMKDVLICENWEGTHNIMRMQLLTDIHRANVDDIYLKRMAQALACLQSAELDAKIFKVLSDELAAIKQAFKDLKQADQAMQTLKIAPLFDRMMILYAVVEMQRWIQALETEDDALALPLKRCYQLIDLLHLNDKPLVYDLDYMQLIRSINNVTVIAKK